MAVSAVDLVVCRIADLFENEVSLLGGVADEIEKIKMELISMKSFMEEAEGNGSTNEVQKTWAANVRDIAYQVEDIIDMFMYHKKLHLNRINEHSRWSRFLYRVIYFPNNQMVNHRIASKLESINRLIEEVPVIMSRYDTKTTTVSGDGHDSKWLKNHNESCLFYKDESLVGIDEAKDKLVSWLLNGGQTQRTVISVLGMGGSGKTTLVANAFNCDIVRTNFDCYAWLTVSQSYVIEDLFRDMVREFYKEAIEQIPGDLDTMCYRGLVEILVNYLQQKRYFVVLDDVWSTGLWREIRVALPDSVHGSKVMLTTRNEEIASFPYGIQSHIHRVEPLPEDEAWALFCKQAFRGINPAPTLVRTARGLVGRCQGLPLAIVALGSMMSTKTFESEWTKVNNTLSFELGNNPELKIVKSILLLSFNDLPYQLKRCFLYCCIFPQNYRIKRKRLIRLWMAQGFVERIRGATPEEVADSYLNELVCRNLLQVVLRNHFGRPKTCKMHDVIREIALSVSETDKFYAMYDETDQERRAQHVSVHGKFKFGKVLASQLRSLFVFSAAENSLMQLSALKMLRSLDFEGTAIDKLPDNLGNLFNLRYLNLTRTLVKELPLSIYKLLYLETLSIKHTKIQHLPAGITMLQNLRHLITFRRNYGHDSTWNCILGTIAPQNVWKLRNLQVLDCMIAESKFVEELKSMTQLTRISLVKVRKEHGSELCGALGNMKHLRFLALTTINEDEPFEADTLLSAPWIKKLFLAAKLEKVPCWFKSLESITYLGLRGSRLREDMIPHLEALPNLTWLSLYNTQEGNLLRFRQGFKNLKVLEIIGFPYLEEIVIEEGAMPDLQKLYLKACVEIKTVPIGIEYLSLLQVLHLTNVSSELVDRIRGEGCQDRPKIQHVPDIKHYYRTEAGSFYETLS